MSGGHLQPAKCRRFTFSLLFNTSDFCVILFLLIFKISSIDKTENLFPHLGKNKACLHENPHTRKWGCNSRTFDSFPGAIYQTETQWSPYFTPWCLVAPRSPSQCLQSCLLCPRSSPDVRVGVHPQLPPFPHFTQSPRLGQKAVTFQNPEKRSLGPHTQV